MNDLKFKLYNLKKNLYIYNYMRDYLYNIKLSRKIEKELQLIIKAHYKEQIKFLFRYENVMSKSKYGLQRFFIEKDSGFTAGKILALNLKKMKLNYI
jgi:hypothetical protein